LAENNPGVTQPLGFPGFGRGAVSLILNDFWVRSAKNAFSWVPVFGFPCVDTLCPVSRRGFVVVGDSGQRVRGRQSGGMEGVVNFV
jgi:hypothetical protein